MPNFNVPGLVVNAPGATLSGAVTITTTSGVQPLVVVGIAQFSRFSRNEAAFGGALVQFDRSGVVAGYVGMDTSDNLTIQRGADAVTALTINRTSGAVTSTVSSGSNLVLEKPAGAAINFTTSGTQRFQLSGLNAADGLAFYEGAAVTERGRIVGGILAWGTTVTTGAAAGNIVLPNVKALCSVNAAGTAVQDIIYLDNSNRTVVGQGGVYCTATSIGFLGGAPIAKQTVTGSRGSNAALASLLTQLAAYGLITDSTTA